MAQHRFRFFVQASGAVGDTVQLNDDDVRHLRVIRATVGEYLEIVDGDGRVFDARLASPNTADLVGDRQPRADDAPPVVLYAGVLAGQRWDALVDGAVQAGVSRIVPLVQSSRERDAVERRAPRMERVVMAAAKQAKRSGMPTVEAAIRYGELISVAPGIVLDGRGQHTLLEALDRLAPPDGSGPVHELSLVVGAASGLPAALVGELAAAGWRVATLGQYVLRSEMAAAVAVAFALQGWGHAAARTAN